MKPEFFIEHDFQRDQMCLSTRPFTELSQVLTTFVASMEKIGWRNETLLQRLKGTWPALR